MSEKIKKFDSLLRKNKAIFDSSLDDSEIVVYQFSLSLEEKQILKKKFDGWSTGFINQIGLGGIDFLVDSYRRIVYSCRDEKSYFGNFAEDGSSEHWRDGPGISYEYKNYISCRTALQIIIDSVSEDKAMTIRFRISEYDTILKRLIDQNPKTFYTKRNEKYPEDIYWWQYKLPINVME